jgi:hypothetical protein
MIGWRNARKVLKDTWIASQSWTESTIIYIEYLKILGKVYFKITPYVNWAVKPLFPVNGPVHTRKIYLQNRAFEPVNPTWTIL